MAAFDLKVQLLMIGDSGVGKTSLIDRFSSDNFSSDYITSIGVDFKIKVIWDTAGQERFRSITNSFYRRAEGILLVYDVTDRNTFAAINSWIKQIEENTDSETKIDIVLIGNKSDKADRKVKRDEGLKLAQAHQFPFFETSAKSGENVATAYSQLAHLVTQRLLAETKRSGSNSSSSTNSSGGGIGRRNSGKVKLGGGNTSGDSGGKLVGCC